MGQLHLALDDAMAGHGRLVLLAGEPGIGKTRAAQELAAHAETQGAQVLWGRCYEEEGALPYWPWVQPLRAYIQGRDSERLRAEMGPGAADIAGIVSELRDKLSGLEPPPPLGPEQARFRLFDSITTFLKNAAAGQPLMLVLDDLHWADKPSLLQLQFLARELGGTRMLVIGTYRDLELPYQHPLAETLAQLAREPVFQRESLRGLSHADTEEFIEATSGVPAPPTLVESIYARTGGNPFFLTEVLRLLSQRGRPLGLGIGGSQGMELPQGIREVIGQRISRLSEPCHRILATASIVGREFDFKLLAALTDELTEDLLLEALEDALAAQVIDEAPQR